MRSRYLLCAVGCISAALAACASIRTSAHQAKTPLTTASTASTASAVAHRNVAFIHVSVIPMDEERILSDQTVLVRDDVIVALGPSSRIRVPDDAVRIDGRGKYLLPGLSDMHTHLGIADSTQAEQWLFLFVANGVTTIRNMDYFNVPGFIRTSGEAILQFRRRAMAGNLWSPRIYTSGPWGGPGATSLGGRDSYISKPPEHIDSVLIAYKAAGYDFIKIHDETEATFNALQPAASREGLRLAGHVFPWMGIDRMLASGITSVEHLTFAWNTPLDSAQILALAAASARAHIWNCPTQLLNEMRHDAVLRDTAKRWPETQKMYVSSDIQKLMWFDKADLGRGAKALTLSVSRGLIKALQHAGADVLLGTDTPAQYQVPGFSVHRELEALVRAGLTPYQALRTGTRNVAAYFGTLDETGTIAVGKSANLILLNDNPLVDIRSSTHIAGVMVGGRWLGRVEIDHRLAQMGSDM